MRGSVRVTLEFLEKVKDMSFCKGYCKSFSKKFKGMRASVRVTTRVSNTG